MKLWQIIVGLALIWALFSVIGGIARGQAVTSTTVGDLQSGVVYSV